MCRNIKRLRHPDHLPSEEELHDAALQFVRKISGFRVPSRANQPAFDRAVREVSQASHRLFAALHPPAAAGSRVHPPETADTHPAH
jgi:hypothetical protein